MESLTFLVASLAVWRLSKVITEEEGPFRLFTRLRASFPVDGKHGWIGRGLYCFWCVSFWIGLLVGLALTTPVIYGLVYGLACSSVAIVFDCCVEYLGQRVSGK